MKIIIIIEIDGDKIFTELDFHNEIARQCDVEQYYGKNLDALWDSVGIERPINLIWLNSNISRDRLSSFDNIVYILEEVKHQDEQASYIDKFTFILLT